MPEKIYIGKRMRNADQKV
ncbi:Protein CBG26275 [Caenorhabditis briggsae]|uniref:Protein CBG26275 n=1 Tax=Caenorhabditis briggsae TaxID=6238 RepID=B6IJI0_CAEBR|nr:Protein CBG26275 [Caenorhabditis briggsae]CAS00060.1 Protein CBG26275 [Caenorhabditis briggsae]